MLFRVSPANWAASLGAAVAVAAFGGIVLLPHWSGWLAIALAAAAGIPAAMGGIVALRNRPDRYDLNRLWEKEPDTVDEEAEEKYRDLAYCHHCGASCPATYDICPGCGNRLGG